MGCRPGLGAHEGQQALTVNSPQSIIEPLYVPPHAVRNKLLGLNSGVLSLGSDLSRELTTEEQGPAPEGKFFAIRLAGDYGQPVEWVNSEFTPLPCAPPKPQQAIAIREGERHKGVKRPRPFVGTEAGAKTRLLRLPKIPSFHPVATDYFPVRQRSGKSDFSRILPHF